MTVSLSAGRGSTFTRTAAAVAVGGGMTGKAAEFAARQWPDTPGVADFLRKSASTISADAPGLATPGVAEFVGLVNARAVLGRLGRARRVPLVDGVALAVSGASFDWIPEGGPTPVGRTAWQKTSLPARRAGGVIALTRELLTTVSPDAEAAVQRQIVDGLVAFLDRAFLDPDYTATPGLRPASLTASAIANGALVPPSGEDADAARADLANLVGTAAREWGTLDGAVLIMSDAQAAALAFLLNPAGGAAFPGLGAAGGELAGVPVLASAAAGDHITILHAPSLLLADGGGVEMDAAHHATLQMGAPTISSAGPVPAELVSLWQTNALGLRVQRLVNWELVRGDGAIAIVGAGYGLTGS